MHNNTLRLILVLIGLHFLGTGMATIGMYLGLNHIDSRAIFLVFLYMRLLPDLVLGGLAFLLWNMRAKSNILVIVTALGGLVESLCTAIIIQTQTLMPWFVLVLNGLIIFTLGGCILIRKIEGYSRSRNW